MTTVALPKCYRFTIDQLEGRLPSDLRWELVEGELIVMSPSSAGHGRIAMRVGSILDCFVRDHDLGTVFAAETGFIRRRDPDSLRAPDAAFVRRERELNLERGFFPGPPDLAVAVASPDDSRRDLPDKARYWVEHGTRECWVIWPASRAVTVLDAEKTEHTIHEDQLLERPSLLPGFSCPVRELFG